MSTICPKCRTEYLEPVAACGWCPGVKFDQPVAYRVYNRNHELKGEFKTMAEVNAWLNGLLRSPRY